jgi:hypothetical protein
VRHWGKSPRNWMRKLTRDEKADIPDKYDEKPDEKDEKDE